MINMQQCAFERRMRLARLLHSGASSGLTDAAGEEHVDLQYVGALDLGTRDGGAPGRHLAGGGQEAHPGCWLSGLVSPQQQQR